MVKLYFSLTTRFFYLVLFTVMLSSPSIMGQCTIGNDIGGFDPQNNFDWAQTFTAECDGFLEYVEFITGSGGTQQARSLEIFEGATVSGTPVYTQNFSQMTFNAAGLYALFSEKNSLSKMVRFLLFKFLVLLLIYWLMLPSTEILMFIPKVSPGKMGIVLTS